MRVGILAEGWVEWQGGIELLAMLRECLRLVVADPLEEVLLFPRDGLVTSLHRVQASARRWLGESLRQGRPRPWRELVEPAGTEPAARKLARLAEVLGPLPVLRFHGDEALEGLAHARRLDALLPSFRALAPCVRTPWIGYLYDFQHRHLPHLFAAAEREARDAQFAAMAARASHVIVNARAVADDGARFLGGAGARFVPLPFGGAAAPEWFADEPARLAPYALPGRYFLVSNQFWTHKNHRLVFQALGLLAAASEAEGAGVVCTGSTVDARDPEHFPALRRELEASGLAARVRILGHIPKRDQIEIMKHAVAVVQPTLFEGGPGGGSVYDAVSLGVPALLSDIPVNRELDGRGFALQFFPPDDGARLAALMLACLRGPPRPRPETSVLLAQGQARRRAVGEVLLETVEAARSAARVGRR